jgi:hypothetical protein
MINESDPLAGDPIARRLQSLQIHVPPMPARSAPAPRAKLLAIWRTRGRRTGLVAGLLVASMMFATAAANADTIARLTQQALNAAGLRSSQVVALNGTGQAAGATATVSGGYGDNIATVLFIDFKFACKTGPCDVGFPSTTYPGPIPPDEGLLRPDPATLPYLLDQYGQRYYGAVAGIGVGAYPSFFDPLAGRARAGARLTLYVPIQTSTGRTEVVVPITGTLIPHAARVLNAGPAITTNGVTYEVAQAEYSGSYLELHTKVRGQLDSVITKYGTSGSGWPGVFIVDSKGRWLIPVTNVGFPTVNRQVQDETRIFAVGAGTYHIVVAQSPADHNAVPGSSWTTLASWTVKIS